MLIYGIGLMVVLIALTIIKSILAALVFVFILYVIYANYLSVIYFKGGDIVIDDFLNPFTKEKMLSINQINKVEIKPCAYLSRTTYMFHLKNGSTYQTFNKLLKSERIAFKEEMESYSIDVVIHDLYN